MLHKASLTNVLTSCNRGVSRFRQPATYLFLAALLLVNGSSLLNAQGKAATSNTAWLRRCPSAASVWGRRPSAHRQE